MSELRRRNIADPIPAAKGTRTNGDATQGSAPSASVPLKRVVVFSALAISIFFWFYIQVPPASVNCYAVCSRSGARVYTVDDVNSTVQCLVIQDEFIVDIGSLGAFLCSDSGISGPTDAIPDDVSARWSAINPSGSTLQIRYIDDESIVVPGLSGQSSAT